MDKCDKYTFAIDNGQNFKEILSLLGKNFRTKISEEEFFWYTQKNPFGESRVYLMISSKLRIVGCYLITPMEVLLNTKAFSIGYGSHFAIDKQHRNPLNFFRFSKFVFENETLRESSFLLGPPNKASFLPHKVLAGWKDFGFLDLLVCKNFHSSLNICNQINKFNSNHESLIRNNAGSFQVIKSSEWLNWRYLNRPHTDYLCLEYINGLKLLGFVVLKIWIESDGYKKMHIMDMCTSTYEAGQKMLSSIHHYANVYDCHEINLWSSRTYKYRSIFNDAGYEAKSSNLQPLLIRPLTSKGNFMPSKNWTFMYGDADGY
jgi:hypothetical protein